MCGRFARRSTQEVLADWFGVPLEDMPWFEPSFNVAPQSFQPVVRLARDTGKREFAILKWGLVPFWAKDAKIGYTTINARAEDVASKPMYREPLKKRRCLVPADAFYEWKRIDPKTKHPFAFALKSGKPWAFAGLWESWRPKEGEPLETFTILTTDPNAVMEPIHNRMPAILEPRDYDRWLEPGDPARPPTDLLRPFPPEEMEAWPVSSLVGNVRNNSPALLDRAGQDRVVQDRAVQAARKRGSSPEVQPGLWSSTEAGDQNETSAGSVTRSTD
jgi:putative SOS response-associated peptidase YedK